MRLRCPHTRLDFDEGTSSILVVCVLLHNWLIDQEDTAELRTDEEYIAMEKRFPQQA